MEDILFQRPRRRFHVDGSGAIVAPMSPLPKTPQLLKATAWMMGTLASFAAMAVAVRELSADMGTFEILFFRSLIGLAILFPLVAWRGRGTVRTTRPRLQVVRNLFHFGGQSGWIYGIAHLPLAEVFAIEFTTPIWVALLAVMFLGERMTGGRIVAVVFGFTGALVILRPGVGIVDPAALVVLAASLGFAITNVLTKQLTNTDPPLAILFYMTIVQLPLSLSLSLWLEDWTNPGFGHAPWLLLVAVTGLSAHYCMARALAHGDATIVIPLDFVRLPLIAVVGFVFYAESLELAILLGAVLIFAGNYYSILTESRRRPDPDSR